MKILIVKPSSLGDIIHALPFISALEELYPDAEISWVVNPLYKDLLIYNKNIKNIMLFDRNAWKKSFVDGCKKFYHLIKELRQEKFDLVIDLQGLLRSALITFLSASKDRIVVDNTREGAALFYKKKMGSNAKDIHAVERIMSVAQDMGWKKRNLGLNDFAISVPDEVEQKIDKFVGCEKRLIIVNPFTRWESKKWSKESYVSLIKELISKGFLVAVTGAPSDQKEGKIIVDEVDNPYLLDCVGKTSLIELVAILKKAEFMVSSDSGPVHLANALGIKTVTLFGSTSPLRTAAYLDGNVVVSVNASCSPCLKKECPLAENKNHCMNDISVERILENIK